MEENIPTFNNKIIGILVAIVVVAAVLVPICSQFSDSGDNGISTQSNEGTSMYLTTSDFWANTGSGEWGKDPVLYSADDIEEGDVICIIADTDNNPVAVMYYGDRSGDVQFYGYKFMGGNSIILPFDSDFEEYSMNIQEMGLYLDSHDGYYKTIVYFDESNSRNYDLSPTGWTDYNVYLISEDGTGDYTGTFNPITKEVTITSGGSGGDTGITGTLISLIPVFVLLAILMTITATLFYKREQE